MNFRAFATVINFSQRYCFKNGGEFLARFSPQYSISCDSENHACMGGNRIVAYEFLQTGGTVSEYCIPFSSGDGSVNICPTSCTRSSFSFMKYYADKNKKIRILRDMDTLKGELMKAGPVTAGMQTYDDLSLYKGGTVYVPSPSAIMSDKHAVNIVGWGNTKGREYFIIQNSWGPYWGENGKINI
jgi:C1A family cysteine protease